MMNFNMTERQQAYINSPHTHPYLKEVMRLKLSINEKELAQLNKQPNTELLERIYEGISDSEKKIFELKKEGCSDKHPEMIFEKSILNILTETINTIEI